MPTKLAMPSLSDQHIFSQLVDLAQQDSRYGLTQFKSLAGAHQYRKLYELCHAYVPSDTSVLDWGCGNGHFSYFLVHQGYRTTGYSFTDFALREKFAPYPYGFALGTPEEPIQLPYADQQFDAVVSVGVLEHVREHAGNETASLHEFFRILKPGGHFICYHFPNAYSWIEQITAKLPGKYHHRYRYKAADIQALCQATGFELMTLERYGFLPRNITGQLPPNLARSPWLATLWDVSDILLSKLFSPICQNYCFVARKREQE
jgi:SAM-dependent methyltransferase